MKSKLVISACLAGENCRYDGGSNLIPELQALVNSGEAITICPEVMGGLLTPRDPSEIRVVKEKRKVYNKKDKDVTEAFYRGALLALEKARAVGCERAVLKARSPSCGCGCIYDGTFTKRLIKGDGITTELFREAGITVMTEEMWLDNTKEKIMEKKMNVGVLFGGQSGEHEISRISAVNVIEVINKDKYDLTLIGITKDGQWKLYNGDFKKIKDGSWETDTENLVEHIDIFNDERIQAIDVFFPILHGPMGEDGTVQGVLEVMNKPYVGCGVLASAVAMDKVMTKVVCEQAGVPTGPYVTFKARQWQENAAGIVDDIKGKGFPVFIKPVNMGSSVGITKAHNAEEMIAGVEEALKYDDKIIIEGFINGREIECAVLEEDGVVKAALPGEIKASKEFYDYEAKYAEDQDSEAVIPAQISDKLIEQIREYAVRAFEAIDGSGLARVDFFVTHSTYKIFLNEINTMPGFTNISLYPKMWEAAGIPYADLVEKLIQSAARKRKFVEYR